MVRRFGLVLSLPLLFGALAGCDHPQAFRDYCARTGKCECTGDTCCVRASFTCDPQNPCCEGLVCNGSGRCEAPAGDPDGGADGGGVDAGQGDAGDPEVDAGMDGGVDGGTLYAVHLAVNLLAHARGRVDAGDGMGCGGSGCILLHAGPLTLVAEPEVGGFLGWDGGCSGTEPICSLDVTQDVEVQATFAPHNLVFVSSLDFGNWAQLTQDPTIADGYCRAMAQDAGLPGTFVAWLSSPDAGAEVRLLAAAQDAGTAEPRGWVRVDGAPVVDTLADLTPTMTHEAINSYRHGGRMYYPIRVTEHGDTLTVSRVAGTGTAVDGTPDETCGANNLITYGFVQATTLSWTDDYQVSCDSNLRLYCFGVDYATPLRVQKTEGRYAFVSRFGALFTAGLGEIDMKCQQEATDAKLPGTYKAFLAQDGVPAAARFDGGVPWVRVDGVRLSPSADALLNGGLLEAPLNVNTKGQYVQTRVWTGAPQPILPGDAGTTCADWTQWDGGASGFVGIAADSYRPWNEARTGGNPLQAFSGCQFSRPVYCFQE